MAQDNLFEKIINYSIYKPIKEDIQFKYLFLGTNEIYYKEVEKHIDKYPNHKYYNYNEKYINPKLNNLFVPIKNILISLKHMFIQNLILILHLVCLMSLDRN